LPLPKNGDSLDCGDRKQTSACDHRMAQRRPNNLRAAACFRGFRNSGGKRMNSW
jgi:hypothetical protein